MDNEEILRAFDRQMRLDAPPDGPDARVDRDGRIVRQTAPDGAWNGVLWSGLDEKTVDAAIAEQVAYFTSLGVGLEWKHYSHDRPADLADRLLAAGFAPEDPETLMVAEIVDLATLRPALPEGVHLRAVTSAADADLVGEVHDAAFGHGGERIRRRVLDRLADNPATVWTWLAMAGDVPVCAARMEVHKGTEFASLWGGGTVEAWRGKGIYRALVAYRATLAAELGCRFLQVDASDQSRPILERLGFVALSVTTPYSYAR
ncbi:GNAT superfamily N-acetyltransferase [Catenulispora sp. GAS73]|uniref:GNAT family N-acetyltransferase n=1 Tax=Catenulispora sp. GAS73 TaxID=3156269 RepID=UPI003516EF83